MKQKLQPLKDLPLHFQKFNKYFYKNTKDGSLVHVDNLQSVLTKKEPKPTNDWIKDYYNN